MTQQDVNAYNARRLPREHALSQGGVSKEAELHRQILDECKRRGWIAFHGSMAHRTFRTPGEPDLLLLLPKGRFLMVELKTKTGKLSPDQQAIHAWAAQLDHTVHILRSMEEFLKLV